MWANSSLSPRVIIVINYFLHICIGHTYPFYQGIRVNKELLRCLWCARPHVVYDEKSNEIIQHIQLQMSAVYSRKLEMETSNNS